ncbi:hypothetical protein SELMODRAFT_427691 [Selaginella moellendorffii]|uniref:Uncharacterized protein n=1 Tax=Selaginella moellendorffii TaxID=88036 RepID=D8T0E7_SELML|nr:hypothetical protein SELMODRAFT_427691 [Selaginella moellendorffii]
MTLVRDATASKEKAKARNDTGKATPLERVYEVVNDVPSMEAQIIASLDGIAVQPPRGGGVPQETDDNNGGWNAGDGGGWNTGGYGGGGWNAGGEMAGTLATMVAEAGTPAARMVVAAGRQAATMLVCWRLEQVAEAGTPAAKMVVEMAGAVKKCWRRTKLASGDGRAGEHQLRRDPQLMLMVMPSAARALDRAEEPGILDVGGISEASSSTVDAEIWRSARNMELFSILPPRYWGLPHRFTVLAAISLLWIALGSIPLYGMSKTPAAGWAWVREVFASSPGTLTDLGVICLVAASQVRVRLPMSEEVPMPEDKVTKFVMFGVSLLLPVLPLAAGRYGRDLGVLKVLLLYAQLCLANCVACLLVIACECRRWGIGVDIAELLPAATLAKSLVVKALSPFPPAAPVSGRRFEGALLHGRRVQTPEESEVHALSSLGLVTTGTVSRFVGMDFGRRFLQGAHAVRWAHLDLGAGGDGKGFCGVGELGAGLVGDGYLGRGGGWSAVRGGGCHRMRGLGFRMADSLSADLQTLPLSVLCNYDPADARKIGAGGGALHFIISKGTKEIDGFQHSPVNSCMALGTGRRRYQHAPQIVPGLCNRHWSPDGKRVTASNMGYVQQQ